MSSPNLVCLCVTIVMAGVFFTAQSVEAQNATERANGTQVINLAAQGATTPASNLTNGSQNGDNALRASGHLMSALMIPTVIVTLFN
ncbi:hypothetical protein V1264_019854 [Littorina saxatilis]|uniref:Uncharacterized protein n=1 Tax=Littorina saxatilis TaxID=31220 RepID=A0AAN9BA84_9CAEN